MFDVQKIRKDFPILERAVNGKPLVYLDNAATSQKPKAVIGALSDYYQNYNANIHRAIHTLGEMATEKYERVRTKVKELLNAKSPQEIVFTGNTTASINLVAYSWGRANINEGAEILLTEMEHHSNLVPWQLLAKEKRAKLRFIPVDGQGLLDLRNIKGFINDKTKLVALTHASNFLGTINPVEAIIKLAHKRGALVLVDGAQSVPHLKVDVQRLDCDFLAFSSHKMLGPTGVGVLYAKRGHLSAMPPFLGGGEMIRSVEYENATWNELPYKFEAGTPNIADVIAFGAAIDYLLNVGLGAISKYEHFLVRSALRKLSAVKNLTIYGPENVEQRGGLLSFNVEGIHAHDLATVLDSEGIAIRSGHHCTMPLHKKLGIVASARASFYLYNTEEEIDRLVEGIEKAKKIFSV